MAEPPRRVTPPPSETRNPTPPVVEGRRRSQTPTEAVRLPPYEEARRDVTNPMKTLLASAAAQRSPRMGTLTAPMAAAPLPPPSADEPQVWVQRHRAPMKLDGRLTLLREPDSWQSACYRVLRHRLSEAGNPRTIAITSAERGEGKTSCAVNLALALGECERARVLLVEANLRNPGLAALFGYVPPLCLSKQIDRHKQQPSDPWSVVEVYTPSLHVAAMDPENSNRPLLDGPAFNFAMQSFQRAPYDYIVIDTPPVLGSADVNLIEDNADGVLLVAWARRSSGRMVRKAVEQLSPTRLLGITLLDA